MDRRDKVSALCGETKVDYMASTWVTMIQTFEYYNSYHLKKTFKAGLLINLGSISWQFLSQMDLRIWLGNVELVSVVWL